MGRGAEAQGPNRCINRAWEDHCEAAGARRAQGGRPCRPIRYDLKCGKVSHPSDACIAQSTRTRVGISAYAFGQRGNRMTFLKQIAGAAALGAALLTSFFSSPTQAGYVVTLQEVGSDVVA